MGNKDNYFNASSIGLSEKVLGDILNVFTFFPTLQKVRLYGSRAKGNFQPYSDIDIVLEGNSLSTKEKQKIELALDDLYLPYIIDVSILSSIDNQDLLDHINRVGKLLYKNENV